MKKTTLVAYFSATGTTREVAQKLARVANADLYEITPQQKYTAADLDWRNKQARSTVEMANKQSRPAIVNNVPDLAQYDTVIIGFPIWWYTAPTIVNTFIEACDLQGKTVSTFATSGGSDVTRADAELKAAYPTLNWKPGQLLNSASDAQLKSFIESLK